MTPAGEPWLDLAHVVQALNKLDSHSPDRVALTSADGQDIMVVTFADLASCLTRSFAELQPNPAPRITLANRY